LISRLTRMLTTISRSSPITPPIKKVLFRTWSITAEIRRCCRRPTLDPGASPSTNTSNMNTATFRDANVSALVIICYRNFSDLSYSYTQRSPGFASRPCVANKGGRSVAWICRNSFEAKLYRYARKLHPAKIQHG